MKTIKSASLLQVFSIVMLLVVPHRTLAQQSGAGPESHETVLPSVGDRAPDLFSSTFDGSPFTLSEIAKNKAVLLWFTNLCSGCQSKLPLIEKYHQTSRSKGMVVVAVSQLGKDRKTVEEVIRKNNLSVTFLYDPAGEATTIYTGGYNPGTCPLSNVFLINKEGLISFASHLPGVSEAELEENIDRVTKRGRK